MTPAIVTVEDIRRAVGRLGLARKPLCVHASLRSFGRVVGGPEAVINGLSAEGCTVMAATFCDDFGAPPPADDRPKRNGTDYDNYAGPVGTTGRVYSSACNDVDVDEMGAVAAALLQMPGRARGNHPLCSFSAVGPLAEDLIRTQAPMDVCAPLRALGELGGCVVLMGVGYENMTLLHLAEREAGRNLFIRWARGPDGAPMRCEAGGCSAGFASFEPVLASLVNHSEVGNSLWRVIPAGRALAVATEAIRADPLITHCGRADCERCNDAVAAGPIL